MGNYVNKQKAEISSAVDASQIDAFLEHVRPLDLLVFRGGDGVSTLITKLEEYKTGSGEISHVEVAITREWCPEIAPFAAKTDSKDTPQTLLSWGSTMSGPLNDGVYNAETGKSTFGVQVRVLKDLVREYLKSPGANVGVCRLIDNPTVKKSTESHDDYLIRAAAVKDKITNAYKIYNGKQYDINPLALLGSIFPLLRPLRNTVDKILATFSDANNWLFCSELAAAIYICVGVITDQTDGVLDGKTPDPRDVLPVDFIGRDADSNGIVNPICEFPPIWIKSEK